MSKYKIRDEDEEEVQGEFDKVMLDFGDDPVLIVEKLAKIF